MASTIKVDNLQNQPGTNIVNKCGTTITLGASGDTVSLASGASQTGFGRSGSVNWDTSSIKTATFTAADGNGYFCNTSGGAFTVNLPAGSAGAIVAVSDYTRTFQDNNLTISPNGSEKIGGVAEDLVLSVKGQALTLVYVDATEGWINVQNAEDTETGTHQFITACGGTVTTSGNDKIHTFTGPGTFTVNNLALCAANDVVSYIVVAGGGGGGDGGTTESGGGSGAGGFREAKSPATPYTASPLDGYPTPGNRITATVTSYPITVGAGGGPACSSPSGGNGSANAGSNSTFSTITSAGGGGGLSGGATASRGSNNSGGSGGGGNGRLHPAGSCGNTPPTTPAQGTNGGAGAPGSPGGYAGGGGGGATATGSNGSGPNGGQGQGGNGGAGATTEINASPTAFAGGGGGGARCNAPSCSAGTGGTGGGGRGGVGAGSVESVTNGTVNTGGGAGGSGGPNTNGGTGGSGIVIIRYKYQ